MTNNELKLLQSAMDHSKSYLEFGSGNSTYMAVATDNIKKITVVESDVTFWETHLMSTPAIYEAVEKGRLHPYLVNIGVTGKWGYPMNDNNRDYWPAYHSCVFQSNHSYDTVLVDGRFRISCILHACHFTGSTSTFNTLWRQIGENLGHYKSYPKIVGETGGKNFIFAHPSAPASR